VPFGKNNKSYAPFICQKRLSCNIQTYILDNILTFLSKYKSDKKIGEVQSALKTKIRTFLNRHIHIFVMLLLVLTSCDNQNARPDADTKITMHASQGTGGVWEMLGFHPGNQVPDFTLYATDGKPFQLYHELTKRKPTVLINASHTCDFSRANLPSIKSIMERYAHRANMVMVYTIDAHPSDTLSPYAEDERTWIPPNNKRDNISTPQPRTYGERVDLSRDWKEENAIPVRVLVDGPDNKFWNTFGQAPNMCYIISDSGKVEYRQTWFNGKELEQELERLTE
jgi:hypothetical protein